MNEIARKEPTPPIHVRVGVITHLIQAVNYGSVEIHFEAGRPTLIKRHETIRLTGGEQATRG